MKLSITQNRNWKNWEGKTFPEKATLFEVEALNPNSLEEHTRAKFEKDIYLTFPFWEKARKWLFSIYFPSWFPTEGDGCVGLTFEFSKEKGFSFLFLFGRFYFGWARKDVGNPLWVCWGCFTKWGFSYSNAFATGIGG